ncbi:RNA recognition motif domain-containing protein [Aliikangiella maris]|uniref:RNA-binding protein n=2 Tax=Aliikangiella maris TaxID=3162458 RepID=A0ABV3MUI2_9GAMM
MKKMFVGNLPLKAREADLITLFSEYGTVRSVKLVMDVFSGNCKGFGFVEMEGHEARAAIKGLNGKSFMDKDIQVKFESPRGKGRSR